MSSSLGLAAAAADAVTVCLDFVAGGLEFALTIEAQEDFIECIWNAIIDYFNIKKINLSFYNL
jgi:hypothetical protein